VGVCARARGRRGLSQRADAAAQPAPPQPLLTPARRHPHLAAAPTQVRVNGHTGWVRALATSGRYLYSCGCNHLRQWDTTYTIPREVASHALFTGDILAIAASGPRVFTAGADGSVRAWSGAGSGRSELREVAARDKAHAGRATALAAAGPLVFSVSYDGAIKGWASDSLELVVERSKAHGGGRIHCASLGPDGLLWTGGDDGLVRRWDPVDLSPVGEPLDAHGGASVRVLAAGPPGGDCVVSGDQAGSVAVWTA
jgi:WD40 repeat protein